ncbi:MAG: ribosome small subunit-dependent GTPase A [Verrucomicrobia bacterium]|jgi:ribosome biogenesis GTPase|nr:ribosome small subunit-dependent GTPase A [Verrucomicrobiota bacterium]
MADRAPAIARLGWDARWESLLAPQARAGWVPGRVAVEDKHHYQLYAEAGTYTGKVTGKFRSQTRAQSDFPKVGDWVAFEPQPGEGPARIHAVLPRATQLARKRKGRETSEQVLVTNVDLAFIVHGLDRELNLRLIERFLVMTREGGVQPVVLLNKTDLDASSTRKVEELRRSIGTVPVLTTCAVTGRGLHQLELFIQPGRTVVFMGASGVGKSSLINRLYGEEIQATTDVREGDAKGRHTTTWREMILLPGGGLVIDTPGMREFHMWMSGEGIHEAFPEIEALALQCHFRDCTHTREQRCAVQAAVRSGQLSEERYQGFLKLRRELEFLESAHRHHHRQVERRHSLLQRRRISGSTREDQDYRVQG